MIVQDKSAVDSQCGCAAGMGPDAHCKHVFAVLFVCADLMKLGTYKTERTCTKKLQTFHRAKPHKGNPLKAGQLTCLDLMRYVIMSMNFVQLSIEAIRDTNLTLEMCA